VPSTAAILSFILRSVDSFTSIERILAHNYSARQSDVILRTYIFSKKYFHKMLVDGSQAMG
jgi:hypothetical protein